MADEKTKQGYMNKGLCAQRSDQMNKFESLQEHLADTLT